MGLKDRTRDFRELADGCQQAQKDVSLRKPSLSHSSQPSRPKAFTTRFAIEADQIGKSLQETMNKLKNLRSLTMDNGIFIDRTSKIDKLTFEIKYDITNLTKKIEGVSVFINNDNEQSSKNSDNIVGSLQKRLASLTTEFREILEIRTKKLKEDQSIKSEFSGPVTALSDTNVNFPDSSEMRSDNSGEVTIDMPLLALQRKDITRTRLEDVQRIERLLVELGGIFEQISHMVEEQGEMIQRIDANVEESATDLDESHRQLLALWKKMSGSRRLTVKIFVVLAFFVVLFVVFFV